MIDRIPNILKVLKTASSKYDKFTQGSEQNAPL